MTYLRRSVLAPEAPGLTSREWQVLDLLAQGLDNPGIAAALDLAEQTVKNRISRIYGKLGLKSRAEAVVWARERGLGKR